jgi:hypothetical protein
VEHKLKKSYLYFDDDKNFFSITHDLVTFSREKALKYRYFKQASYLSDVVAQVACWGNPQSPFKILGSFPIPLNN